MKLSMLTSEHVVDIVSHDLAAIEVVAQVVRRLSEILDELFDVVVLSRAATPPAINRPIETAVKLIGVLLRPCQQLRDLLVVGPGRKILGGGPIPGDAICERQIVKIAPQILPIAFDISSQWVARDEAVDRRCASQHVLDVGGTGLAILHPVCRRRAQTQPRERQCDFFWS